MKIVYPVIFYIFLSTMVFCQDAKVSDYLSQIQEGNTSGARVYLNSNKDKISTDPDLMFLDAVLTAEGNSAIGKYEAFIKKFPRHYYADAALFNIYSYNFAMGFYKKAGELFDKLKSDYPGSKYIRLADFNIPDDEDENAEKTPVTNVPVAKESVTSDPVFHFTVQAGAFSNRGNAEKLRSDLEAAKVPADISEKTVAGTVFNIVTAGRFETREEAGKFLDWLKSNMNLTGRIIDL